MSLQGNNKAIDRMFRGVSQKSRIATEISMKETLKNAVLDALAAHESHEWGVTSTGKVRQPLHLILGDTYGWMLVHNGVEIAREVIYNHRDDAGRADLALNTILSGVSSSGWVGVVMASMEPLKYYSVNLERQFLNMSADQAVKRFSKLFKQNYK